MGIGALIIPAGMALADNNSSGASGSAGLGVGVGVAQTVQLNVNANAQAGAQASTSRNDNAGSNASSANASENASATSSDRNKGQRGEVEREEHATQANSSAQATSGDDNRPEWGAKGGLVGFFRWIFGLPATTTVGEIRSEMQATTAVAGQAVSTTSPPQRLAFSGRLLSFFPFSF